MPPTGGEDDFVGEFVAIMRAASWWGRLLILLGQDLAESGFLTVVEPAWNGRPPAVAPRLPKASMEAFSAEGAPIQEFYFWGEPGMLVGWKLLETWSKMPAFSRSFSRVS